MSQLKKSIFFLVGMMLTVFALPSFGAPMPQFTKQFTLTLTSDPLVPRTVQAHLRNVSQGTGNSTITAITLTFAGVAIDSVVLQTNPKKPGTPTINGGTLSVTDMYPLKVYDPNAQPPGPEYVFTITLKDCGDNVKLASATAYTVAGGQTFTNAGTVPPLFANVSCVAPDCATNVTFDVPTSAYTCAQLPAAQTPNANCVRGTRGYYDKDGATTSLEGCSTVPFFVTNVLISANKAHFRWPSSGASSDEFAAFSYTINLPSALSPQVAWFNDVGTQQPADTGNPDFIDALPCNANANFLPAPYGTLVSDGGATITVDATSPALQATLGTPPGRVALPALPFDIMVETERMTVTGFVSTVPATAEVWNVTRAVGGTQTPAGGHTAANLLVMSTPLPIMAITQGAVSLAFPAGQYVAGDQAQMCVHSPGVSPGTTFEIFDIGDGWGGHP